MMSTTRVLEICNPLNTLTCMHGGQCLPMMNGYQCLCTAGYTGRFCEISKDKNILIYKYFYYYSETNQCASNPCKKIYKIIIIKLE